MIRMIRVSRNLWIAFALLIVLVIMLRPRKEGAAAAPSNKSNGSCYNSVKSDSKVDGPKLNAARCNGLTLGSKGKCYKAKGDKWVLDSKSGAKCTSWVKRANWKSPNNKNIVGRYPVYDNYKRSGGRIDGDTTNGGQDYGDVESCIQACDDDVACAAVTMKKANADTTLKCYLKKSGTPLVTTGDGKTWYSYVKKNGESDASGSSSGGDGDIVYLYETANFEVNRAFGVDEYKDLGRTHNFNDKAKSMVIPKGLNVTVYEDTNFSLGDAYSVKAAATFGPGRHVLSDPEFIKSLTPNTTTAPSEFSYSTVTARSSPLGTKGWADHISSMKVFKV